MKGHSAEVTSDKFPRETTENKRVLRSTVKKSNIENDDSKKDDNKNLGVKNKRRGIKRTRDKFESHDNNIYDDYEMNTHENKNIQVSTLSPACFANINSAITSEAFEDEIVKSVSFLENDVNNESNEEQNIDKDSPDNDCETTEESCSLLSLSDQTVDSEDIIRKSSRIQQRSSKINKDSFVSQKTSKAPEPAKNVRAFIENDEIEEESINLLADCASMTSDETSHEIINYERQSLKSVKSSVFFVNKECPELSPSKRIKASSAYIPTSLTSCPSLESLDTQEECFKTNPGIK